MAEQIMWAEREPYDGRLLGVHEQNAHSIRAFFCDHKKAMPELMTRFADQFERYGYRCVRVRVTEVQDAEG